jgi:membrane-bound ClpP family serine protease
MANDQGIKRDEVIEIIRSLEAKFYSIGTQIRWLGIALFLVGVFAAITGADSWSYVILILGIAMAIIGAYTQYFFGPKMDS